MEGFGTAIRLNTQREEETGKGREEEENGTIICKEKVFVLPLQKTKYVKYY